MAGIYIAGTDYKVGKTHVACALLRSLRANGYSAVGFKPIACGSREEARAMREATDTTLSLERINPIYLRAMAEPLVAADLERKTIDINTIKCAYKELEESGHMVIVEGTGGWTTPVNSDVSMADVARALQLPILLVAENKLGAAHLISLTIDAIKASGLTCCGIILNHIGEEWDTASVTNRPLIEKMTGIPVVAELIHGQDELEAALLPVV